MDYPIDTEAAAAFVAKADADDRLRIRAELARRMGWEYVEDCWHSTLSPAEKCWRNIDPDPFTNAEDNRALVAWLAADTACWNRFTDQLYVEWKKVILDDDQNVKPNAIEWERFALTASCETITFAAARALGIPEASE